MVTKSLLWSSDMMNILEGIMDFSVLSKFRTGVGMVALVSLLYLFLTVDQRSVNRQPILITPSDLTLDSNEKMEELPELADLQLSDNGALETIQWLINKDRGEIEDAMTNFKYDEVGIIKSLNDLIPERGGTPLVSFVITTWRSGSTFLGDVMHSHPGSFYHYEPLLPYGIKQIRSGPESERAIADLKNLMKCNYSDNMEHYIAFGKKFDFLHSHNRVISEACRTIGQRCYKPAVLGNFCKLYPLQTMKSVRLRANLTDSLLSDTSLRLKVLLLVRDPRGTLLSRHHRDWCPGVPDCENPATLCSDLVNDYHEAKKLIQKYPSRFSVVRYEDISLNVFNETRDILDFFDINYTSKVETFLETHTKTKIGGVSSTYRDSKEVSTRWKTKISWKETQEIQSACKDALSLWGYNIAKNENEVRNFNPVGDFKFPPS